jgi:aryl sulfotransferase
MLIRTAARQYRTWILDSRRWDHYRRRDGDIIIATYPKCGTTWMQRIVQLLVFQSVEAVPLMKISPWIERRFPQPVAVMFGEIEAQTHRRFLKTHLPADGIPFHDDVKYIHVARDGRDAVMSYHNHTAGFTAEALGVLDHEGLEDPEVAAPYPRTPTNPATFFHDWLTKGAVYGHEDGLPATSFFQLECGWWELRGQPNVLLVHFNDLKANLAEEMRRIADFLEITVVPDMWPDLIEGARFDTMRRHGSTLMAHAQHMFKGGSDRFFHAGTNRRWEGVFTDDDLALYDQKATAALDPACIKWIENGRLFSG